MHAVIRTYSGANAKQLLDFLEKNKPEIERELRKVKGLTSYTLLRTHDGGVSFTVCQDKAGTDESVKIARDWIQKNGSQIAAKPPVVTEGSVILHLK